MSRQILITGLACLIAAGVLVATILFSPAMPDPDEPLDLNLPDAKQFAPHDPKAIANRKDGKQAGTIRKYFVRHWDAKRKQLSIFSGDSITPKPNGVAEVVGPAAQIHLDPGKRVIVIQGKEGTIIAPNNNIESGEIRNGVVVSFFATDEDRNVDLSTDSKDVTGRIFLDEAVRFDLELGTLESDGPVYGTSAMGEYRGRGLNLILNERQKRINQFIIHHGEEIRLKIKDKDKQRTLASPESPTNGSEASKGGSKNDTKQADNSKGDVTAKKPGKATYYRLLLNDQVDVTVPEAKIKATELAILFAVAERGSSGSLLGNIDTKPTAKSKSHENVPDLEVGRKSTRSLFTPEPSDWIIRWTGPMRLDPLDTKPEELAGAEDRIVAFRDAEITTKDNERILASSLDYRASDVRVRIKGNKETPFRIASAKLGRLHGQEFVLLQNEGTATLLGPGEMLTTKALKAAAIRVDGKPVAKQTDQGSKVPSDMAIRWSRRVNLVFFKPEELVKKNAITKADNAGKLVGAKGKGTLEGMNRLGQMDALKSATFDGDVEIKHKQFDLAADTLGITMSPPTKASKQPEPHRILAKGAVHATARGSKNQPPIDIKAGEFAITFKPDAKGKAQPARFIALDDVRTSQPGRRMRTETLDVELVPVTRTNKDEPTIAMRTIRADKNVFIELDEPRTRLTSERLLADVDAGTLEVEGTDDLPATIMREDNLLTGKRILMREKDRFVKVSGPGTAVMLANSTALKDVKTAAAAGDTPRIQLASADTKTGAASLKKEGIPKAKGEPQRVKINWSDGMEFNDVAGQAKFMGQVVATSDRKTDVTRFQAGELLIELTPAPAGSNKGFSGLLNKNSEKVAPAKDVNVKPGNPQASNVEAKPEIKVGNKPPAKTTDTKRVIQRMTARHQVVFEAEKWRDRVGGALDTRFRLTGPTLTFDQTTEVIAVDGAGSMQIEDYRKKKASTTPVDSSDPTVAFVGQGVTLFLWKGELTLDAKKNDMVLNDKVQMIQLAKGSEQPVQMDCNMLNANFASSGGLATWLSGKPPEPDLETVTAAGKVRVIHQDKTISSDRLVYQEAKRLVVLTEREGYFCTLDDAKSSLPAKSFKWYLDKDKIIAVEPGAVRARFNDEDDDKSKGGVNN